MAITSCASFDHSRARVAYYRYVELRSDAGNALSQGDCKSAETEMKKAVDVAKDLYRLEPQTYTTLTEAYKLLGHVYAADCFKRYEDAIDVYNIALNMRQNWPQRNEALVANVMNDLGWTYFKFGKLDKAESYLIEADQIYSALNTVKKERIIAQFNLSNLYRSQNRIEKELEFSKKTHDSAEELYFSGILSGPETAFYLREYSESLIRAGNREKAKVYDDRALKLESEK